MAWYKGEVSVFSDAHDEEEVRSLVEDALKRYFGVGVVAHDFEEEEDD